MFATNASKITNKNHSGGGYEQFAPAAHLVTVFALDCEAGRTLYADETAHQVLVPLDGQPYAATLRNGEKKTVIEIKDGQVVLLPSGTRMSLTWHQTVTGSVAKIDPTRMKDFVQSDLKVLIDGGNSGAVRIVPDTDLTGLAERMLETASQDDIGRDTALQAMSQLFIVTLVRNHAKLASDGPLSADQFTLRQFQELCQFVDNRLDRSIRVEDLASVLGVSISSLQRKLGADTGLSPAHFVAERRLKRAKSLLEETSQAIGTIAFACGFADQAHLARAFKRHFRLTPSQHRKATQLMRARHSEETVN